MPQWTSVRKVKEGETTNDLFGFLTTDANDVVAPIHHDRFLNVGGVSFDAS